MTRIATWVCRVLGVLFILAGVVVFVSGPAEDQYHNLLHFVTGLVAAAAGFGGHRAARIFCLGFGAGYLGLGGLGFAVGNPAADYMWHLGPIHLASGEHIFHLVLGGIVLLGGILTRRAGADR